MAEAPLVITVSLNPAIDRIVEVPQFAIGRHQHGRLISRTPAGKAVNVSRVLAALGAQSIATGFVGEQEAELFKGSLDREQVQVRFLSVAGTTRENITLVDPAAHVDTHILDAGFVIGNADRTRLREQLSLLCQPESIVVFSGSVPDGITLEQFAELLDVCMGARARVVVDTSGPPLRAAAGKPLWLMKPNVAELGEIAGTAIESELEMIAAGRRLTEHIDTAIVSRGEAGALCFARGSVLRGHVPVSPRRIRNTVGSGDSMLAGYIAAQILGDNRQDSFRRALAVATASAVSIETCRFALQDVAEFLAAAVVEPVMVGPG